MNTTLMNKLFWHFWFATTILTGILAGFMISHILQLGRFFTWAAETGHSISNFTVFRIGNRPYDAIYDSFLLAQLAIGIIWTVLAFLSKRERIEKFIAIIAGLATVWVAIIFIFSGMGEAESAYLSGTADASMTQNFALLNLPVHTSFAIIYSVSFFLLLVIAYRNLELKNLES